MERPFYIEFTNDSTGKIGALEKNVLFYLDKDVLRAKMSKARH